MTIAGAAVAMAARRRRSAGRPKPVLPDLGTPETRARLTPPPWADWPRELQEAAEEIELAVRLLAGGSMAQAQDLLHLRHHAGEDAPGWQVRLIRRYTWWRWEVVRRGSWHLGDMLEVIVHGAPCRWPEELAAALRLYASAPRAVWRD